MPANIPEGAGFSSPTPPGPTPATPAPRAKKHAAISLPTFQIRQIINGFLVKVPEGHDLAQDYPEGQNELFCRKFEDVIGLFSETLNAQWDVIRHHENDGVFEFAFSPIETKPGQREYYSRKKA